MLLIWLVTGDIFGFFLCSSVEFHWALGSNCLAAYGNHLQSVLTFLAAGFTVTKYLNVEYNRNCPEYLELGQPPFKSKAFVDLGFVPIILSFEVWSLKEKRASQ